jgi:hypothetical protein
VSGARRGSAVLLVLAVASAVIVLVTFAFTTLVEEPGTAIPLVVILLMSIGLDVGWKRRRAAADSASGRDATPPNAGVGAS